MCISKNDRVNEQAQQIVKLQQKFKELVLGHKEVVLVEQADHSLDHVVMSRLRIRILTTWVIKSL